MHQRMYLCNADGQLAAHLPCNMHNAASFCSRPYREFFFWGGCDTICQRASQERDASLHERRVLSQKNDSAMGDRKFCEQSLRALPCTACEQALSDVWQPCCCSDRSPKHVCLYYTHPALAPGQEPARGMRSGGQRTDARRAQHRPLTSCNSSHFATYRAYQKRNHAHCTYIRRAACQ